MHPTRAAWFFAAGIAWLVLRGILVRALPPLQVDQIAQHGGALLVFPLISVVASFTAPLFFFSFLRRHRFPNQRILHATTFFAVVASLLSAVLVLSSFIITARGSAPTAMPLVHSSPWLFHAIPLLFVGSLTAFLAVFAWQSGCEPGLRRSAGVAAIGTLIPTCMIVVWVLHTRFDGAFLWYPPFSQSLAATILGLTAAGALLWFLETFAKSYDDGPRATDRG